MRNLYSKIDYDARITYNKIKEEYKNHYPGIKLRTILESEGYSKSDLDEMSSELLIKIAEKWKI